VSLKDRDDNILPAPSAMREKLQDEDVWFVSENPDGYNLSAERREGAMSLRLAEAECEKNSLLSSGCGYRFEPFRIEERSFLRSRERQKSGRGQRR